MGALLIFLTGILGLYLDPQIPQIVKTVIWILFIIVGIVEGVLGNFKL